MAELDQCDSLADALEIESVRANSSVSNNRAAKMDVWLPPDAPLGATNTVTQRAETVIRQRPNDLETNIITKMF